MSRSSVDTSPLAAPTADAQSLVPPRGWAAPRWPGRRLGAPTTICATTTCGAQGLPRRHAWETAFRVLCVPCRYAGMPSRSVAAPSPNTGLAPPVRVHVLGRQCNLGRTPTKPGSGFPGEAGVVRLRTARFPTSIVRPTHASVCVSLPEQNPFYICVS